MCDLCGEPAACWDHCHDHGYVRAPLCRSCNGSEALWPHTGHGMRHLMACPGCREAGRPPLRSRFARISPTLQLLLRHPLDDLAGLCPGRWIGHEDESLNLLRQLSAGHLHGSARCNGYTPHDTVWEVCTSRERFLVLDQTRIASGQHLTGQIRRPDGYFWIAEHTPVLPEAEPPQTPMREHPAPARGTVAIPGSAGHRLQAAWGSLLEDIADDIRWTRRGRSMTLHVTTDTPGLIALDILLSSRSPHHEEETTAERNARWTTRQRLTAALAALRSEAPA